MSKIMFLCEKPTHKSVLEKFLTDKKYSGRAVIGKYGSNTIILFPLKGHVMGIPYPNDAIEKFKNVSYAESIKFLPVMPEDFSGGKEAWFYKKVPTNKKIYYEFKKAAEGVDKFVLATDPDNEGASLGVEVLMSIGRTKDIIAYMNMDNLEAKDLLQKGFEDALRGKGKLDWRTMAYLGFIRKDLDYGIGVNTTRFLQVLLNSKKSFGTQQTRLLYEITKRYLDYVNFKKKKFYKIAVTTDIGTFYYRWFDEETKKWIDQVDDKESAQKIAQSLKNGAKLVVESIKKEKKTVKSPKWYDGSDVAVEAGKILKVNPVALMDEKNGLLEEMYLKGVTTYPRGDSKGMMPLSQYEHQVSIAKRFAPLLNADRCDFTLKKNHLWYEDGKVQVNHTPFTIAGEDIDVNKLSKDEKVVFDILLKRLLSVFYPDALELKITVNAKYEDNLFALMDTSDIDLGYKELYGVKKREKGVPDTLTKGDELAVKSVKVEEGETKPQPLYTPSTLINMMKRKKIGTQATYRQLYDTVMDKEKGFLRLEKGKIVPTEFTIDFLRIVPDWAIHILDEYEEHIAEKFEKREITINEALKKKNEIIKKVFFAVKESVESNLDALAEKTKSVKKEEKAIAKCPLCGEGDIVDKGKYYACSKGKIKKENGKWVTIGCQFKVFKEQKIGAVQFKINAATIKKLAKMEGEVEVEAFSTKKNKKYKQRINYNDKLNRIDLIID